MEQSRGSAAGVQGDRAALEAALPAYDIGEVLGRGAFAVVFEGRHRTLDREVAIKRLTPDLPLLGEARERFAAEARLLARLDHPHVVRVHDYVESEDLCALVMERLRGGTLAERMAVRRPSAAASCAIVAGVLSGLEHAHQHGVLHRDVKPENLLFGGGDLVKVGDFGIAKVLGAQGARLTATAGTLGTPRYMAPEQVLREVGPLSAATDVWAVGAILFELLTGESPFPEEDRQVAEMLLERVSTDPRPITDFADVPPELAAVVMRALARSPSDRYESAGEFAADLLDAGEHALGPGRVAATGIPIHLQGSPPRAALTTLGAISARVGGRRHRLVRTATKRRRRRALVATALAAVTAGAAVLAISVGGGDDDAPGTSLADLPPPPAGWPKSMAIGIADSVEGPRGAARRVGRGGMTYAIFDGDVVNGLNWKTRGPSPSEFAREAQAQGLLPFAIYYHLRSIGRNGIRDAEAPGLRKTLVDRRLMRAYWENVRDFMKELGSTGRPVAVDVEPSVWAAMEQAMDFDGEEPGNVPAVVGSSGLPELRDVKDNFEGYMGGWKRLRGRYAPNVLLGYGVDDYGTNVNISGPALSKATVEGAARREAKFLVRPGETYDFMAMETAFNEQGQYNDAANVYSAAEKDAVVTYIREFVRVSQLPVVLQSVPLGNSVMRSITDKPFHYRDNWVEWLMGDDDFTGLKKMRDVGVIGVQLGIALGGSTPTIGRLVTCACDAARDGVTNDGKRGRRATSADDDGGYLAERAAALRRAGGLPLR